MYICLLSFLTVNFHYFSLCLKDWSWAPFLSGAFLGLFLVSVPPFAKDTKQGRSFSLECLWPQNCVVPRPEALTSVSQRITPQGPGKTCSCPGLGQHPSPLGHAGGTDWPPHRTQHVPLWLGPGPVGLHFLFTGMSAQFWKEAEFNAPSKPLRSNGPDLLMHLMLSLHL